MLNNTMAPSSILVFSSFYKLCEIGLLKMLGLEAFLMDYILCFSLDFLTLDPKPSHAISL